MGSVAHVCAKAVNGNETGGKVISCRAAVLWGPKQPLYIEEVQVDPPQKMEVRLRILYSSVCHTDLGFWLGENESQQAFPRILGHEAAGVVESVGEGVTGLSEGDHVVPIFNGECGACSYCESRKTNQCERLRCKPLKTVMDSDGKTRFSLNGKPIYHFLNTSTFSEYTVLDAGCVVKIDPTAPLDKMCLLSCGVSTGVGAVWNTANVETGATVAVFGLGAVGIAAAEGARTRKASRIIGVDINPDKFIKGKTKGITDFVNPNECDKPVHEVIREMTGGGVDYSFECAGNLDVLREAFLSTHNGGGLTVILGVHPTPRMLPVHPMELMGGRSMVASAFGGFKKTQLPDFAVKCMNGEVNLEGFITHEMPFSKINEAFKLLAEGKCLRCLLHL
ncbi:hypothetical protein AMTRI_Chr09g38520 [Amborella trichopoda]|uniref:alcohol dehydrogenase-like 4 n=1 Tax=Amborella trichopoda TaxID=13333 RepID=UPI0009BE559D|nr:alcohol dehydrogenase-like 4 [Amborella trichopoda]|eukprot:XP_011620525.2 alcohol dehydrogenase-like 4 [Amborella trichopoda]